MLTEKQQQAQHLYFQTDLNKSQIASLLGVSRRSLHYWIKEHNWERIRKNSDHLPSVIAENCYIIMSQLTDTIVSELRLMRPVTRQEADTLHKLTLTVGKLKNRAALNESIEMMAYFMEYVARQNPEATGQIITLVNGYIAERADISPKAFFPPNFNSMGRLPVPDEPDPEERRLDNADHYDWYNEYEDQRNQAKNTLHNIPTPDTPDTPEIPDTRDTPEPPSTPQPSQKPTPKKSTAKRQNPKKKSNQKKNNQHAGS